MNVEETGLLEKRSVCSGPVGFIQRVEPSTLKSLGTVRSAYKFSQFLSVTEDTYGN